VKIKIRQHLGGFSGDIDGCFLPQQQRRPGGLLRWH